MDTHVDTFPDKEVIAKRLGSLAEQTGIAGLHEARRIFDSLPYDETRDYVNTRLMDAFKTSGDASTFSLLYDLNSHGFLCAIQNRIRAYRGVLDACDVLQEVFFNIYRYPHKFDGGKPEAFRHWANTIIRNTVLKHLRQSGRPFRFEYLGEEIAERADSRSDSPLHETLEHEGEGEVARAYLTAKSKRSSSSKSRAFAIARRPQLSA
jgi:DNA-directed RNA polymerase specialized sigma24 family protein